MLFKDVDRVGYASIRHAGHRETWPLRSKEFEFRLRRLYYDDRGQSPAAQGITEAVATLEARAIFDGPTLPVVVRLGGHHGRYYLDPADDEGRAIEISRDGWRLVTEPPVHFQRSPGMRPLPVPQPGGTLDELRGFINVASDGDWKLLVGWLLSAARPTGQPYPLLALQGEQ